MIQSQLIAALLHSIFQFSTLQCDYKPWELALKSDIVSFCLAPKLKGHVGFDNFSLRPGF